MATNLKLKKVKESEKLSNKRTIFAILIVLSLLIGSVASVMAAPVYQDEATASVNVADQSVVDGAVVVAEVVSPGAGWIVVHADEAGAPGPIIGQTAVEAGANADVSVTIDADAATDTLYAMLHEDDGDGEFDSAKDKSVKVDDKTVVMPFSIAAATEEAATEEMATTEEMTSTAEMTATEEAATEEMATTEEMTSTAEMTATEEATATEETATEEAATTEEATAGATATASSTEGCEKDYTVAAGDTLGAIANSQLGNSGAYQAIADATNAVAATDKSYGAVADVNTIEVGQKLCIPAAGTVVVAPATTETTEGTTATEGTTTETATTETTTTTTGKMMLENTEIAEGMVGAVFENLSGYDVVLDLVEASGATVGTKTIAPNTKHVFVVKPGGYSYNGSTPGGGPGVSSSGFDLKEGQWAEVIIYGGAARQITVNEIVSMKTTEAAATEATTTEATTTEATTTEATTTEATTTEVSANAMLVKETELAEGMVAVLFENLSGGDLVIDLIGPTTVDAQFIAADAKYVFAVKPGSYSYNGSSISSGSFDVATGQWAEVIIYGGEKKQITVNEVTATETATTEEATTTAETTEATEMVSEEGMAEETATEEATTEEATTEETATEEATEEAATEETTLAPPAGQSRMYYQNLYTEEYVIDFGDGSGAMKVAPGTSEYTLYRDFAPGKYNATVNLPGAPPTNFDVELGADTSWIVRVTEDLGVGTAQVYP
jgi:hypothetical protein